MFIFTNENKNIRTNKFKYYYLVLFFLNLNSYCKTDLFDN